MVMLSIVSTDCFIIKLYVISTFIAMPVLPIPPVHLIPDLRKKSLGDFFGKKITGRFFPKGQGAPDQTGKIARRFF
jgi:hypothetical protein